MLKSVFEKIPERRENMDADFILIRKMRNGDEAAMETFIRKYYPSILRYCRYHTGDENLAEDLTQETFERFFRSFPTYRHMGKLANYLYVIAGNICKDAGRKTRMFQERLQCEADNLGDIEQKMDIREALNRLPEELREILILYYFAGLKLREIAALKKISLPLVKYRLKKGKEMLREDLGEEGVQ